MPLPPIPSAVGFGRIAHEPPPALVRRAGPAMAAIEQGWAFATGGILVRAFCALPTDADVDLLVAEPYLGDIRDLMLDCGYTWDDRTSQNEGDPIVYRIAFRPPRLAAELCGWRKVDCLVLGESDNPADFLAAAHRFVDSYDYDAGRQLCGNIDSKTPVWCAQPRAIAAMHADVPGWRSDGLEHTSAERKAKWDALLPGRPGIARPLHR